jgi:hypothetical protein
MSTKDTELVSILVPKQHLGRIYGFISTLDDSSAPAEPTATSETPAQQTEEAPTWTDDLIRRQFNESPDIIKRCQKRLADHQGEWLSMTEIATRLNAEYGPKTVRGALGAYGRRTSNRYKMTTWPFQHQWNHMEGQQYYSMDQPTAEIINSL